jgi:hypothetical protein
VKSQNIKTSELFLSSKMTFFLFSFPDQEFSETLNGPQLRKEVTTVANSQNKLQGRKKKKENGHRHSKHDRKKKNKNVQKLFKT